MIINLHEGADDYTVPDPDGGQIYNVYDYLDPDENGIHSSLDQQSTTVPVTVPPSNEGDWLPVNELHTIRSFYLKIILSLYRCSNFNWKKI